MNSDKSSSTSDSSATSVAIVPIVDTHQQIHDVFSRVTVKIASGLICKDYLGFVEQGSGYSDALLLSS